MEEKLVRIRSEVLGREIPVRMLIPAGEHLKCLLLLHGYDGNQDQWVKNSPIAELAAQHGFAVVMPGCGNGYYEDTQEDMPRFLGEELVAWLQRELPVSNDRSDLWIAGVSMGGFGALLIGAKYPQMFGKIAAFSGAFIIHDVVIGNPGVLGNAVPAYFRAVFGDFETLEGSARDPVAEAVRAKDLLPPVCLLCGTRDVLYAGNCKTADILRNSGVDLTWFDGPGGHEWPFWAQQLPAVVAWLLQ